MRRRLLSTAAALVLASSGAAMAQSAERPAAAPSSEAVQVESVAVPGLAVRAARVSTEVDAPFDVVAATVADFAAYREFLPQVRESRVIQRRRGQQDVYVQVPLLDGLGVVWSLLRFDIRRTPSSILADGHMAQGNMNRADIRIEAAEIPGTRRTRLTMQVLGIPNFPVPASFLSSQQTRWTERGLRAMRERAERRAGLAAIARRRASSGGVSPTATTRRPPSGGGPRAPQAD